MEREGFDGPRVGEIETGSGGDSGKPEHFLCRSRGRGRKVGLVVKTQGVESALSISNIHTALLGVEVVERVRCGAVRCVVEGDVGFA